MFLTQTIKVLWKAINQKQNVKTKPFQKIIDTKFIGSSSSKLNTTTLKEALFSTLHVDMRSLAFVAFLSLISLLVSVGSPLFNEYIVRRNLNGGSSIKASVGDGVILLIEILMFKVCKILIFLLLDIFQMVLAFKYYSVIVYHILNQHYRIDKNAKILNLIQIDSEKLSNLPYTLMNIILIPCQIIALIVLLQNYLNLNLNEQIIFCVILLAFTLLYTFGAYLTFFTNLKVMNLKDNRLQTNIYYRDERNNSLIQQQRNLELLAVQRYLHVQILIKFLSYSFFFILYYFSFIWIPRERIEDNKFVILIILGMIKTPIDRLIFSINFMVEICYSFRRISQSQSQGNIDQATLVIDQDKNLRNVEPSYPFKKCIEKGEISFTELKPYYKANIPKFITLLTLLIIGGLFYLKVNYFQLNKLILSSSYHVFDVIILAFQSIYPLFVLWIMIFITKKLSASIFQQFQTILVQKAQINTSTSTQILLAQRKMSKSEFLNRIAGDIIAIDKSLCLNSYQFISISALIISSLVYSLLSLQLWISLSFFIVLTFSIGAVYKLFRFIMFSRREIARKELFLKSNLINQFLKGKTISSSSRIKNSWRKIYQCKYIGLLIENCLCFMTFIFLMILSVAIISCCIFSEMEILDESVVVIACMSLDNEVMSMLISATRCEKAMLSFERVLNAVKKHHNDS